MLRLSSNATLFFKLFLPVFWTTIVAGMTLVIWFAPEHYFGGVPLQSLRYGVLFLLITGVASFWFLLWPLKRVETDGEDIFVSNYFRTTHYNLRRDVEAIHENKFLIFRICTIELNGVGSFGRRMKFLADGSLFKRFREEYGEVVKIK